MNYVLIVDDEAPVRRLIHRWVDAEGHTVVEAASAEQGLLLACQYPPGVALCDIHMPRGQNGFWLVEQLRRLRPEAAAVMTTGVHEFDAAVMSLRAGATDYVVKPLARQAVVAALRRAVEEHESRKTFETASTYRARRVAALMAVLYAESENAARHAQRVSQRAVALAQALGVMEPELSDIGHAALLRDIVRVDVHAIARNVPYLAAASTIAVAVQERFDGTGFPLGLTREAIPRGARVVAVADAYDALIMGAERTPVLPAHAIEILCGERGTQFDPIVLRALKSLRLESPSSETPSIPA